MMTPEQIREAIDGQIGDLLAKSNDVLVIGQAELIDLPSNSGFVERALGQGYTLTIHINGGFDGRHHDPGWRQ